ncbi:hypothetical protein ACQJBY_059487 [Aegilops geniculata]
MISVHCHSAIVSVSVEQRSYNILRPDVAGMAHKGGSPSACSSRLRRVWGRVRPLSMAHMIGYSHGRALSMCVNRTFV